MSLDTNARIALTGLTTARADNRPSAYASMLATVAEAYANNGGTKTVIQQTQAALYKQGKKGPSVQAGTPEAVLIGALEHILMEGPLMGARPSPANDNGKDREARNVIARAFAQQVQELTLSGLTMCAVLNKARTAAKKATKEAEEAAKQVAPVGTPTGDTPADDAPRGFALPALVDKLADMLADDVEASREALEHLPTVKAIALQWKAEAQAEAHALAAELAQVRAELEGLKTLHAMEAAAKTTKPPKPTKRATAPEAATA